MSNTEILEKLKQIFREILDQEDIELTENSSSSDIEGWDSLMHITLIGAIEDEFGIKIDMGSLSKMKRIDAIIDVIQGKK